MTQKIKAGIVGGTGYTGVELIRLLSRHPHVELKAITSRTEAGTPVSDIFPSLRNVCDLVFSDSIPENLAGLDVVFFATPHGVAMKQAHELLAQNTKIVDLAADYRLKDTELFKKWYGMDHLTPDLLQTAVYGLAEVNRDQIKNAKIIGNPGCYPTTAALGLYPLLNKHLELIKPETLVIDAKSGISGAGKKAEMGLLFSETSDSFKAYGVSGHRHQPEIMQQLNDMAGTPVFKDITFVPHLIPNIRGMFSTIYINLTDAGKDFDFQKLYEEAYAGEPFVDVMPPGSLPETRSVRGANVLRLSLFHKKEANRLIILVVQDNLVKGAAGQAIQNMNIMFDLPEIAGLDVVPLSP